MSGGGLRQHAGTWAFHGIEFPGSEWLTTDGHDSARHQGFGQRGARIETTGPKATTIHVKAMLYNGLRGWTGGALFPVVYEQLLRALRDNPEATLTHPTRGDLTVHVDDIQERGDPKVDGGITLELSFTEQNGSGDVLWFVIGSISSHGDTALAAARAADAAQPEDVNAAPDLGDKVAGALEFLEEAQRGYAEAVVQFELLSTDIAGRLRDPAAAIVDAHPFREALYETLAALQAYRESYLADEPRAYTVQQEASLAQIAALPEVYGDASRASDLLIANRVPDPTRVPAGTELLVVD